MVSKYENSDAGKDKSQCALQEVEVVNQIDARASEICGKKNLLAVKLSNFS